MAKRGVALIGMPGAGKTGVGKRVAQLLGRAFIDTDASVEKSEGMSVSDIFAQKGEPYFRAREREAVAAAAHKCAVISCGGGAALDSENARVLKEHCTVAYLAASLETLVAHVGNGAGRPLLDGDVRKKTEELLALREGTYTRVADITVNTDGKSVEEVAAEIVRAVRRAR